MGVGKGGEDVVFGVVRLEFGKVGDDVWRCFSWLSLVVISVRQLKLQVVSDPSAQIRLARPLRWFEGVEKQIQAATKRKHCKLIS